MSVDIKALTRYLKVMVEAVSVTNFQIKTVKNCYDAINQQQAEIEALKAEIETRKKIMACDRQIIKLLKGEV